MDNELKSQEIMYIMLPFAPLHETNPDNDNVFAVMVEAETCFACKKYIKQKAQVNYNIANDNYFICIPNNFEDCQRIFEDTINGISISLGNFFSSVYAQTISNYVTDDIKTMLQTKYADNQKVLDELTETIKEKDDEIFELHSSISSLKNQLSMQAKSIDEQHKSILEHNNALQRKVSKLEKLNALLMKSKQTDSDNIQETNLDDVDEIAIEIDCNCKYVFVGFDKNGFQEQVLKHFPNAIFVDSNVNLTPSSADMVIMLTNHITHPVYYGMKEQCKNKQIPFIHCKHSNIELIKELIWNHIND
jgi:hypothetical protein